MSDKFSNLATVHSDLKDRGKTHNAILAVGEQADWDKKSEGFSVSDDMVVVSFDEVTAGYLDYYTPTLIVSPAMSPAFDCIELAMLLRNIGYKGAYRAIVRDMPRPELIEREVKSICPLLDFGIFKVES